VSAAPILRIERLTKRYGDFTALHGIDLEVADGEFLTIVGPSGSGKTTLIKLLVGMEEQSDGAIWLREKRLDRMPANRRPTCMVFQSLALFPHRSVGENIAFPLKIRGEGRAAREARARELLDLLHLPQDYHDKRIDACSGGERQRIALARALAFDPQILFFDEPLSALDYRLRKTLEKELKALHERTGKTFVYITHSLEEAMVMSDRIAILRNGRFEQIGTAHEIYARPRNRFVARFMGDVNLFELSGGAQGPTRVAGLDIDAGVLASLDAEVREHDTVMVRPERLRLLAPDARAEFVTDGRIAASYLLGSRRQYEIDAPDGSTLVLEAAADAPGSQKLEPGRQVRIGFDRRDVHFIAEHAA